MEFINLYEQSFSFIGRNSKITGLMQLKGPTKISSEVEGEIDMLADDPLAIEILGNVKGNIRCFDLEIFGTFEGIIYAKGSVIIHHTAQITGEINSTNLIVHPGAKINADVHTNESLQNT